MKILLLNPHIDAAHEVAQALQTRGVALLQPADATEAWQMLALHGTSVELAIIHREDASGAGEPGMGFVAKAKADPAQADLPLIVTSQKWSDAQCAEHQKSKLGANAYLRWPFDGKKLVELVEAVTGVSLAAGTMALQLPTAAKAGAPSGMPKGAPPKAAVPKAPPRPSTQETTGSGIILEEASAVFASPGRYEASDTSIRLEAPELPDEPPAQMSAPPPAPGGGLELSGPPSGGLELSSGPASGGLELSSGPEAGGLELSGAPPSGGLELSSGPASGGLELSGAPESGGLELSGAPESGAPMEIPSASISGMSAAAEFSLPTASPMELGEMGESSLPTAESSLEEVPQIPRGKRVASARVFEPPPEAEELTPEQEEEMAQDMPYLFGGGAKPKSTSALAAAGLAQGFALAQAVGDAVVPGGAAHSPDMETLKKYLLLREQDVAALSTQLKSAKEQLGAVEETLRAERSRNVEYSHTVDEQKKRIEEFEREKALALDGLQSELTELRFQIKAKGDRARVLEIQVREATDEMSRLKERVRTDIRKIRIREKELENRLEIMKKDSEALITARENKIIELKRKLDLLEFNMDLLQDQYNRERETAGQLREKLAKAAQVVRLAGGLLESGSGSATATPAEGDDDRTRVAS